jgi:hypothetical protein
MAIEVFVGCDMEGDFCLYVKRGGKYLTESQLDEFAPDLDEFLNSDKGKELLPLPEDDDPDECECNYCDATVSRKDQYFATPCGTFCDDCMTEHAKECGVCAHEFDIQGDDEEDEGEADVRPADTTEKLWTI